jgi:hypothetical protein
MELCGVSSLPFAVGVYLPLSASTPIFAGGLVRYAVDRFRRRPQEGPAPEPESDMSPGVLLSTGYIAGGTIAGVLVAFLSFSDAIPRALGVWQYRQFSLAEPAPVDEAFHRAALHELGPKPSRENLDRMVDEIKELNSDLPPRYAPVPAGTTLRLPGNRTHAVREATTLGDLAREVLADERQASTLFDLNQDKLKPPAALPAGVGLKVPQHNYPAVLTFAMLAAILVAVGLGWIMQPPAEAGGSKGKS